MSAGHALVLGDGDAPTRAGLDAAWPGWDEGVSMVIAADGGARLAEALSLAIDHWVGDGDSLAADALDRLRARGVATELVPAAKDASDLELALARAIDHGVGRITILGALRGPRLDHELANVFLLAHPALGERAIDVALVDPRARVSLVGGSGRGGARALVGRRGDLVSLFPLDEAVEGVSTTGLEYALDDEPLQLGPARGLSNVRAATEATVAVRRGRLLIVETPVTVGS